MAPVDAFVWFEAEQAIHPRNQFLRRGGGFPCRVVAQNCCRYRGADGNDPPVVEDLPVTQSLAHPGDIDVAREDDGAAVGTAGLRPGAASGVRLTLRKPHAMRW